MALTKASGGLLLENLRRTLRFGSCKTWTSCSGPQRQAAVLGLNCISLRAILQLARGSTVALHRQSHGTRDADTDNHGRGDGQRRMVGFEQWRGHARSWLPLQRADVFVECPRAGRCRFLACSVSGSGPRQQSGDRLHRRMPPMSLGLAPRPLGRKTKRKTKEQKHGPPEEGRGEGEGQTQTSNLFGEERRKNPLHPSSQTRESHSLVPDPLPA